MRLVLEFGFLQFGTAVKNLLAQGCIAKPCYNLAFLHVLASLLYAEHDYLF